MIEIYEDAQKGFGSSKNILLRQKTSGIFVPLPERHCVRRPRLPRQRTTMSSFAQDSSHGRLNPGRLPAAAGISLRPRLLLLAGGWAAGVASAYYYDRTLGMRKVTSASQTTTKTSPKGLQPDQRGAAEVQAASTHVIARQDPTPTTPPQTGAAAVWRGVFDPGKNLNLNRSCT